MPFKRLKVKVVVHYAFRFSPKCSKIAICGLLEMNYAFMVTALVTQLGNLSSDDGDARYDAKQKNRFKFCSRISKLTKPAQSAILS